MSKNIIIGVVIALILFAAAGTIGFFWGRASDNVMGFSPFGMMGRWDRDGYGGRGGMMNNRYNDYSPRGGMMGGRGMMGYRGDDESYGFMHNEMTAALAEKLGMTAADLQSRLDKGESFTQIAESKGFTGEKYTSLLTEAHTNALEKAVKDGKITQEQADWMKERGGWMNGGRGGFGRMDCPFDDDIS